MDFDPQAYLDAPTTQASERRPPVPVGDYVASITDLLSESWTSKDKVDPVTGQLKSGIRFDIVLKVDLPAALAEMCKIPALTIKDGVLIDRTAENAIDYSPGKNSRLRQYREACGLNTPGEVFTPRMLIGRTLKVRLTHEEYQGNLQERAGALAKVA